MSFYLNDTTPAEFSSTKTRQAREAHPTNRLYPSVVAAYNYLNESLFDGSLPSCLITLQRSRRAYGYFAGDRFANKNNPTEITDEIALNPHHFASCTPEKILSVLAHEMAHLWQHHFGHASRWGYHNKEWARKMCSIGLIPSNTEKPGGKETGRQMSHYIAESGPFAQACAAFLSAQEVVLYHDRDAKEEDEGTRKEREKKAASKTKFTCTSCGANAWGKPDLKLICEVCPQRMEAVAPMEEDPDSSTEIWSELREFAFSLPQEPPTILARQEEQCCSVRCKRRSKNRTLHLSHTKFSARHRRRRKKHLSR